MPIIMLVDNGSVRSDATLGLRILADNLSDYTSQNIYPVSLRHADSISIDELNGISANVFLTFMQNRLSKGEKSFVVLPLFFGESKALTSYLSDSVVALKKDYGEFDLKIAKTLASFSDGKEGLASILYDHVLHAANNNLSNLSSSHIVLVDHGSPSVQVTAARETLAKRVQAKLQNTGDIKKNLIIDQAVMERREGSEYDFNGQLLEDYLLDKAKAKAKAKAGDQQVIVILMFFLSGRHAGKDGDISKICSSVTQKYPDFKIEISPLMSEHRNLVLLLDKQLENVLVS